MNVTESLVSAVDPQIAWKKNVSSLWLTYGKFERPVGVGKAEEQAFLYRQYNENVSKKVELCLSNWAVETFFFLLGG